MSNLNVKFVAADREVWEGEASRLIARTTEGEIGILPGHQPLLSVLIEGDVVVVPTSGERRTVQIDGGFLSVDKNVVTVVAQHVDMADAS